MVRRIFISVMIVCMAVSISGCHESQEKQETSINKPAPTASKREPPRVVTGEERKLIVAGILKGKMRIKDELETNLEKLREDLDAGTISLSKVELNYIEKNLNDAIANEEKEIEAYKADLKSIEITKRVVGTYMIIGTNKPVSVLIENKGNRRIRHDKWTGKPKSEQEMNIEAYSPHAKPLKMYRFDGEGRRYLYATYDYGKWGRDLQYADILNRDGTVRERLYKSPYSVETSIGEDKWVKLPYIKIYERGKLVFTD